MEGLQPAESARLDPADLSLWSEALARIDSGIRSLPDKPEETSVATVRALWHLAAGEPLSARLAMERTLSSLRIAERSRLRALVDERLSGTPLAHQTRRQSFMGIEMLVGPEALIPRSETEVLARAATALLHRLADGPSGVIAVDVCTGSGNLAAALAISEPRATVYASDLSAEAVALAQQNLAHLGLDARVTLRVGDLLEPFDTDGFRGSVDLVTCNPPYISTGRLDDMPTEIVGHEPSLAFDGGPLGVRILQRLIRETPRLLRPGGWLAFEVGAGQGPAVLQRLRRSDDYAAVEGVMDATGEIRAVLAERRSEP